MTAIDYMRAQCSKREYCSEDVLSRLKARGSENPEGDLIVLRSEGYVDDRRYARCFASDKARLQGWGPVKIAMQLRCRKIEESVIAEALELCSTEDAALRMEELVSRKWASLPKEDAYLRRMKTLRYAVGRGYEYDAVMKFLDKLK